MNGSKLEQGSSRVDFFSLAIIVLQDKTRTTQFSIQNAKNRHETGDYFEQGAAADVNMAVCSVS